MRNFHLSKIITFALGATVALGSSAVYGQAKAPTPVVNVSKITENPVPVDASKINLANSGQLINTLSGKLIDFGIKVAGAILLWWIGGWLIRLAVTLINKSLKARVDGTVLNYLNSVIVITLKVILIVAIMGYFGIETSSFAALLAGFAIAIGAAWGGLLSNFAAGFFLLFLRPIKVGDFIEGGGISGFCKVKSIGMFNTVVVGFNDNAVYTIPNAKLFNDNIKNYDGNNADNDYWKILLKVHISRNAPVNEAIKLIKDKILSLPNVLPNSDVTFGEFTTIGYTLNLRPCCEAKYYFEVLNNVTTIVNEIRNQEGYKIADADAHYLIQ
jgi:small conductance mechanosensitive channel